MLNIFEGACDQMAVRVSALERASATAKKALQSQVQQLHHLESIANMNLTV